MRLGFNIVERTRLWVGVCERVCAGAMAVEARYEVRMYCGPRRVPALLEYRKARGTRLVMFSSREPYTGRAVVLRAVYYSLIGTEALILPLPFPAEDK
jgi:hypothetical protein